jgi:hypothetical protein
MADIDFLILADHADVVSGKLFLNGGGWTEATVQGPNEAFRMGIALGILVPWGEANRPHRLALRIEHEDGGEPLLRIEGTGEAGRPAGAQRGADLRSSIAFNGVLQFPRPGGYRVVADIGQVSKSLSFRVNFAPGQQGG